MEAVHLIITSKCKFNQIQLRAIFAGEHALDKIASYCKSVDIFLFHSYCLLFLLGFYMYIETSPLSFGDKAKLIFSPLRVAIGKWSCLKFYYHMYGDTINRLNVFIGNSTVFTKSGQQGNVWMYAEVTVFVQNNVSSSKAAYWSITEL